MSSDHGSHGGASSVVVSRSPVGASRGNRRPDNFADLKRFCRHHGLRWPVGRIVGGPLPWHIRHPEKVARASRASRPASSDLNAGQGADTPMRRSVRDAHRVAAARAVPGARAAHSLDASATGRRDPS